VIRCLLSDPEISRSLVAGDPLTQVSFDFENCCATRRSAQTIMASIRFETGPRTGERIPLDKEKLTFGRAKSADCVLAHPTVSREHFIIELNNSKVFLVDKGSENGTYANGERVSWVELNNGDKIHAGPFTLVFESLDTDPPVPETRGEPSTPGPEDAGDDQAAFETTQSGILPSHYLKGIEHFNAGQYFDAHEVWEEIWLGASGETKLFYQMLIQAAVAMHHYERGNARGARGMHANVLEKLNRLPSFLMSLDLDDFSRQFRAYFSELIENNDESVPSPDRPRPRIRLLSRDTADWSL
jgi:pSer/pThr/pTyr-binding forkhead associated (FHA) protein